LRRSITKCTKNLKLKLKKEVLKNEYLRSWKTLNDLMETRKPDLGTHQEAEMHAPIGTFPTIKV
jgi:hypothetical protein